VRERDKAIATGWIGERDLTEADDGGPGAGDAQVEVRRRRMHLKKATQIDPILALRHHALPFAFQKVRASSLSG